MRVVHRVRDDAAARLEPLCGDWGSMDTHWTEDAAGVTCAACLGILRDISRSGARGAPAGPAPRSGS